jgi:predicted regulator of amino acid metabolism with ACT domain
MNHGMLFSCLITATQCIEMILDDLSLFYVYDSVAPNLQTSMSKVFNEMGWSIRKIYLGDFIRLFLFDSCSDHLSITYF